MPQLIVPIVLALATVITWEAAAALVALSLVSMLITPSQSKSGRVLPTGQLQEYTGTVEPRRIVYGRNLISGINVIPPWCHGSSNEYLDQVLVLAGHQCSALGDVYLNQEIVVGAGIGAISGTANDGLITTTSYANKIWARRYAGAQTTVDYILALAWPSYWTSTHVGRGMAYIALQYLYDAAVFQGGKPEIKVVVDGKLCYDPRLDTSPGAHPTNVAYFAFTSNPALCIIDYLLDGNLGVGEAAIRVDWVAAVAAANTCDELVSIPGATTQKRYTCNVVLDVTDDYESNLQILAGAMQGAVLYSSGKWVLFPGKYITPSFAIGDDDIAGQIDFRTAIPYKDRYNAVRGQFYDPTTFYQPVEYSPARSSADEAADGELVWHELQQATCTNGYEAQRNAMILQRMSRRRKTFTIAANYGMYGIRPGEFGTLTISELGLSALPVKCLGWKLDGKTMAVQLALTEVASADWNDPGTGTYAAPGTILTQAPPNFTPAPTTFLSADGVGGGVNLRWTLPAIWYNNLTVDVYEATVNNWSSAVVVWSGVNTGVFIGTSNTVTRYYWTKVRNMGSGTRSALAPISTTGGVSATPLTGGPGPQGPPGDGGLSASLSMSVVVLNADSAGHVSVYPPLIGKFRVFKGLQDVTTNCLFSLAPNGNVDGLAYTLNTDGTYSIDGAMPDDVDVTQLVLRAVYIPP